jgi:hypothetical protein
LGFRWARLHESQWCGEGELRTREEEGPYR